MGRCFPPARLCASFCTRTVFAVFLAPAASGILQPISGASGKENIIHTRYATVVVDTLFFRPALGASHRCERGTSSTLWSIFFRADRPPYSINIVKISIKTILQYFSWYTQEFGIGHRVEFFSFCFSKNQFWLR